MSFDAIKTILLSGENWPLGTRAGYRGFLVTTYTTSGAWVRNTFGQGGQVSGEYETTLLNSNDGSLSAEALAIAIAGINGDVSIASLPCADPERGHGIQATPPKNHKNIGFLIITIPDSLKMAFRWRAYDGLLIMVFGFSLPSSTLKKTYQSWTRPDKTIWIRTCLPK